MYPLCDFLSYTHTAKEKSSNQEETRHKETKSSAIEGSFGWNEVSWKTDVEKDKTGIH